MLKSKSKIIRKKGSPHQPPEERRIQILNAAITCFTKDGFQSTSMDSIAIEAELSKGSLYRFFSSKDDLLLAILDEWEIDINHRIDAQADDEIPLKKLFDFCYGNIEQMATFKTLTSLWIDFFRHEQAKEKMINIQKTARAQISSFIEEGVNTGQFKKIPPQKATDMVMAILEGVIIFTEFDKNYDLKNRFLGIWDMIEETLLPETITQPT